MIMKNPKYHGWFRSSHQRSSIKNVLKNFAKFTGKHLCQSLLFNQTLLKKRLWRRYLPANFSKFLRIPFLQSTSGRLLLLVGRVIRQTSDRAVNTRSNFKNLRATFCFSLQASKARQNIWMTRLRS